ncbi:MAG: SpoIVB peptidase S55 domain-containing protein, partial [Candidatus Latescibacteria bacterium]|nr:SpoIVB peptidase S55 domain-containing protein [Candidatus Latescibacterota bacterium]
MVHRLAITVLSALLLAWFGPARNAVALEPGARMSVDKVQRGMVGVGRSVFRGTRIDTFQVEIIGTLHDLFGPGRDIILAELSGAPLEEAGVIQGMSGSPVFIDGKLIGAVSHAIGPYFTKRSIAGIRPIDEMLDLL